VEQFGFAHYRQAVHVTAELALQAIKGVALASSALAPCGHQHIILPTLYAA